jgi:hypothetical protein
MASQPLSQSCPMDSKEPDVSCGKIGISKQPEGGRAEEDQKHGWRSLWHHQAVVQSQGAGQQWYAEQDCVLGGSGHCIQCQQ